jgi:hypothetical protein
MRRLLAVAATVLVVAGITATAAGQPASASSPDTELCFPPFTLTVAGHPVTTPEICVPIP